MEPEIIYKFPPNDTNDLELNNNLVIGYCISVQGINRGELWAY